MKHDRIIAPVLGYLDSVRDKETAEKQTCSRSHSTSSKRSSQCQRHSETSIIKKEENEKTTRGRAKHFKTCIEIDKRMRKKIQQLE